MAIAHEMRVGRPRGDTEVTVLPDGTERRRCALLKIASVGLAFLWMSAAAWPSWAQTGNQASIDGVVRDETGAVVAGVTVSVRLLENLAGPTTSTNEHDGTYLNISGKGSGERHELEISGTFDGLFAYYETVAPPPAASIVGHYCRAANHGFTFVKQ